ncbi:unnamed protein product [Peniophora sp. CBMAI 1063]|nr:unnamed protein product [Peniophora sp. CBMAI 1063]
MRSARLISSSASLKNVWARRARDGSRLWPFTLASPFIRVALTWLTGGNVQHTRARVLSRMNWLLGLAAAVYFVVDGLFPPRALGTALGTLDIRAVAYRMVEDRGFQRTETPDIAAAMLARMANADTVDFVSSDKPDVFMCRLDTLYTCPNVTSYRARMYTVHAYSLSVIRRHALVARAPMMHHDWLAAL